MVALAGLFGSAIPVNEEDRLLQVIKSAQDKLKHVRKKAGTYKGRPCKHCGTTERRASNGKCLHCLSAGKRKVYGDDGKPLGAIQYAVLRELERGDGTANNLAQRLGMPSKSVRFAINALKDRGLIHSPDAVSENKRRELVHRAGAGESVKYTTDRHTAQKAYREAYVSRTIDRIGKERYNLIYMSRRKGASVVVHDGVKIWERGKGILV